MPSALMHISGAATIRERGNTPKSLATAIEARPDYYRVGAILPDLPLFDRFWLKVTLFLAKRPYPESRWGTVVHARGAGTMVATLLGQAIEGDHPQEHLALSAGALTHIALDRSMHVPIEEAVRRHVRASETSAQLHEAIENHQCLSWHRQHAGHDGLGTPAVRGIAVGPAEGRTMPGWLVESYRGAFEAAYHRAPSRAEVTRWTAGLVGYRDLMGSPAARIGIRSSERMGSHRPWVAALELEAALSRGMDLAEELFRAAATAFEAKDAALLVAEVGDGPLV